MATAPAMQRNNREPELVATFKDKHYIIAFLFEALKNAALAVFFICATLCISLLGLHHASKLIWVFRRAVHNVVREILSGY